MVYVGDDRFRYYANPSLIYLGSGVEVTELLHPWGSEENPILAGGTALFVLLPGSRSQIDRIRSDLECGEIGVETLRSQDPRYWHFVCDLPDPSPESATPLLAQRVAVRGAPGGAFVAAGSGGTMAELQPGLRQRSLPGPGGGR